MHGKICWASAMKDGLNPTYRSNTITLERLCEPAGGENNSLNCQPLMTVSEFRPVADDVAVVMLRLSAIPSTELPKGSWTRTPDLNYDVGSRVQLRLCVRRR